MGKRNRYKKASDNLWISGITEQVETSDDPEEDDHITYLVHRTRQARRAEFHLEYQNKELDEGSGRVVKRRWRDLQPNERLTL